MNKLGSIRRDVGAVALLFTGLGSIIGSGWLFGAWRAAQLAGPGAIYAWLIGAVIMLFTALTYSELGTMFPESGGMVRYGQYTHGSLVGFIAAWSGWIATLAVISIEADASVQYMASWPWQWAQALYSGQELSSSGLTIAAALIVVYFLLNYWGVRLFARANSVISIIKLFVPAATAITLLIVQFQPHNFEIGIHGEQHAIDFSAVLTTVAISGIALAYAGFQSPINLAGEARTPGWSIPLGVLGSIVLAAALYILLQISFTGAVSPSELSHGGWSALNYRSPFAELALSFNLNWLALILYSDSFISPLGTGLIATATTGRMIYAMEKNGTLPPLFGRVHPRWGVPRAALWLDLGAAFIFLFLFRGWAQLAEVISVTTVISYLNGPISVMILRRIAPDFRRPFKVPGLTLISPMAFVFSTELLYWARWPRTGEIIVLILVALPVYFYYQAKAGFVDFLRSLTGAIWMIAYLPVVALLSYVGSTRFGGLGIIPFGWDLAAVGAVGVIFFLWGVHCGWRTPDLETAMGDQHN